MKAVLTIVLSSLFSLSARAELLAYEFGGSFTDPTETQYSGAFYYDSDAPLRSVDLNGTVYIDIAGTFGFTLTVPLFGKTFNSSDATWVGADRTVTIENNPAGFGPDSFWFLFENALNSSAFSIKLTDASGTAFEDESLGPIDPGSFFDVDDLGQAIVSENGAFPLGLFLYDLQETVAVVPLPPALLLFGIAVFPLTRLRCLIK